MTQARSFVGEVRGGRFLPEAGPAWVTALGRLEGKRIVVSLKRWFKQRTNPQNRYFHGPLLDLVEDWSGNTRQECRSAICREHLSYTIVLPDGSTKEAIKSTADLDTAEWETFMLKIRADFAQHGLFIPLPNERGEPDWSSVTG